MMPIMKNWKGYTEMEKEDVLRPSIQALNLTGGKRGINHLKPPFFKLCSIILFYTKTVSHF